MGCQIVGALPQLQGHNFMHFSGSSQYSSSIFREPFSLQAACKLVEVDAQIGVHPALIPIGLISHVIGKVT